MTDATAAGLGDALRDRYTLERQLGRGGMATVYLAHDLRYDRSVALKVLHPELAATLGPERFLREIKLCARLQHPHILSVYDSGEAAGRLWFTMPYVEGESLRERLRHEPQLPLAEALRITREAAQALGYAHEHGIIHRDVKPENILITKDGNILLADFGIARALQGTDDTLTQTGLAIGTPAYMSPEQAAGARTVDAHTDVYSLGCVLYEMLAGEPPYTGPTPQAIVAKRFHLPIPSIRHVRPEIPASVDHVLHRALALSPADRFATVTQLSDALADAGGSLAVEKGRSQRRVPHTAVALGIALLIGLGVLFAWRRASNRGDETLDRDVQRLAVLPFRVLGDGQEMWGEGMVDLLSINLDGAAGLRTIHPRTVLSRWHREFGSAQASANQEAALQVAKDLGARYSVTGTVLATGPRLRLTVEVEDVLTDAPHGRASVEGSGDSVPALVDRLSLEMLRSGLLGGDEASSAIPNRGRVTTTSVVALKAYLDGERAFRRSEPAEAETAFRRAVEADSAFALAHYRLALATAWTVSPHEPTSSPDDSTALRLADRLPVRDRQLLTAHVALNEGNPGAIRLLAQLTESHAEDAEAWYLLGEAYFHLGWFELSPRDRFRAAMRRAISLDPGFTLAYLHLAEDAFSRFDSAATRELIASLREHAPESPKTAGVSLAYALSWGDSADRQRARATVDTASTLTLLTAKHTTNIAPDFWQQTLVTGLALAHQARHPPYERATAYLGAALAYLLRGRVREALALSDTGYVMLGCADCQWRGRLYLALFGLADSVTGDRAARELAGVPDWDVLTHRAMYSATRGRFEEAEGVAALMERGAYDSTAMRDSAGLACGRTHAKVIRTFAAGYREGPLAIPTLREVAVLPYMSGCDMHLIPLRFLLIRILAESENAEDATPYFNGFDPFWDFEVIAPLEFYRGRVAERLGDLEQARYHYSRFVSWWDKADVHLQPFRDQARDALARLAEEPGPS